jgi:hypothetical protein
VHRKKNISFAPESKTYSRLLHRPLNQLAIIGPLLVFFHVGAFFVGDALLVPYYLRNALMWFGITGRFLPGVLIIVVLFCQYAVREDPLRVNGWVALGSIVESAVWTLPLVAISWITARTPAAAMDAAAAAPNLLQNCLEAVGAGVYEEFLFRLVLFSLASLLFVDLLGLKKVPVAVGTILVSGVLFSVFHSGWFGPNELSWPGAVFLALAGMWWGVLFLWRGFAVAACAHIWWDLVVIAFGK